MARRDAVPQHRLDQRADAVPWALSVPWAAERPAHPINRTERTRQLRQLVLSLDRVEVLRRVVTVHDVYDLELVLAQ